jgi:hypothetical protein
MVGLSEEDLADVVVRLVCILIRQPQSAHVETKTVLTSLPSPANRSNLR